MGGKEMSNIQEGLSKALEKKDGKEILRLFQEVEEGETEVSFLGNYLREVYKTFEDKSLFIKLFSILDEKFSSFDYYYSGEFLPVDCLIETKEYKLALRILGKCEDENCPDCTPEWVYFYEGKCYYGLKDFDNARWRLVRSIDGDYDEMEKEAREMIDKIDARNP